jgi:hypothetical protein
MNKNSKQKYKINESRVNLPSAILKRLKQLSDHSGVGTNILIDVFVNNFQHWHQYKNYIDDDQIEWAMMMVDSFLNGGFGKKINKSLWAKANR